MRTREIEDFLQHRSVSKVSSRSDPNNTGPCNNSLNQISSHEFSNKSVWLGPSLRHTWSIMSSVQTWQYEKANKELTKPDRKLW